MTHSSAWLANAAEAKNKLVQEQLMFQVFMSNPNSAASKAYFEQMSLLYLNSLIGDDRGLTTSTFAIMMYIPHMMS